MASHPGDLFDYDVKRKDARKILEVPHWVALPTTSGTGSEVGRSTVISDDTTKEKKIIFSPHLLARAVFADPSLTLALPPGVTASTGMDALTHCVEAFLSTGFHPMCDGIALEGLRLISESIESCVANPHDISSRSKMMMASMMGAVAFQKGLGVVHSCAHALSTLADLHHGLANGVMIAFALPFNESTVPERFSRMGMMVGLRDSAPLGFVRWLIQLRKAIGIPDNLSCLGLKADLVGALARVAHKDSCHESNPKAVREEDFHRIFSGAFT
jgi:hypothetical protein